MYSDSSRCRIRLPHQRVSIEVRVEPERETVRVSPIGELCLATAPSLSRRVNELLGMGFDKVVVDLHGLSFMDLSGLHLLLALAQAAKRDRWRLSIEVGRTRQVQRILVLTGAIEELPIES